MEGDLLADEIEANTIIQYNPTGWFIIAGDTAEQALENEEFVRNEIAKVSKEKVGYLCTSLFIPSIEKQSITTNKQPVKTTLPKIVFANSYHFLFVILYITSITIQEKTTITLQ